MFCFKCGGSMPDDATVCPQCGAAVASEPAPAPAAQPPMPPPASASAWLNVPPGQPQQYAAQPPAYPGQGQAYPYPAAPPPTDGKAVASLILGIVSIALCMNILSGIPAVILGHVSLSSIRKSGGRLKGNGLATAGLIMGYIGIAFGLLYIPALLIPSMLRSRMAANTTVASAMVRSVNSSQSTYSISYPAKGFAADLATLGPGPGGSCAGSGTAEHACLLDNVLGNATCTAGTWCTKSGYRFSMSASCEGDTACKDYVIVATPVTPATGSRSICSTSDLVLRAKFGTPLSSLVTAEECQSWPEMN